MSSIWPIDRTLIRCYHAGPEWTWERRQWRGTPHSPKLQHCWNLTIRLFSVISRILIGRGGLTPLQRSSRCILQPQPTGQKIWIERSPKISRGSLCSIVVKVLNCNIREFKLQSCYYIHFWTNALGKDANSLIPAQAEYDTKQSDDEASVILEFWGMQNTPSLSSLPDPLWPRVVAPDRVLWDK